MSSPYFKQRDWGTEENYKADNKAIVEQTFEVASTEVVR